MFLISVYSGYSAGLDYGTTNVNSYLLPRIGFHFASMVARYNWNWISISYIFNIQGAGLVPPRSEYAAEYP